jgi:eukaryotic-like serine/threonine-protein kinase
VTAAPDQLYIAFQAAVAGRYSLDREVGRGGMGIVYLAKEVDLDRPVAIKLLPPDMASDPALRARFVREARTAARLSHPNIIAIHVVDEVRDFVFFAMAYVDGETLAERVRRRGPLPPSEAARLLREVAWALAHAHAHGVVHRDVKPDNILLEAGTGRAVVADFGIAAAGGSGPAEVTGTPEFMSPEQALGQAVDARSDIYAFGATAYFALSGTLPFEGRSPTEVLAKQVTEAPRPLATVAGALPRRLVQIVERCLAKDPAERPQSAEDVGQQLGLALEQRRELPVALRAFVKHSSRLDGGAALIYPFALLIGAGALASWAQSGTAFLATLVGGMTLVPLGVLANRARRLLKQGFGHVDLAPAFKAEIEQGREERAVDAGLGPSFVERALRVGSVVGFGAFSISLAYGLSTSWWPALRVIAPMGWGAFWVCAVGALILLQRRRDVDAEAYGRLWTGVVGRMLFGLARTITPRRALAASVTHRPTELSIGLAAEQLYEGLPRETRRQLENLPDVLRRLEGDAQRLRKRHDELAEAVADGRADTRTSGQADGRTGAERIALRRPDVLAALREERDVVHAKLASTVAALETIRLNLLRLHAGSGSVASVTTDLGLAFAVAKEVDLLLDAGQEVDEALRHDPET